MKNTIKITAVKSATVVDAGAFVGIELKFGLMSFGETLTPDQAQALGDALLRSAQVAQAAGERAGAPR